MDKYKYIALIIFVLVFSACTQQNIKINRDTSEVSEEKVKAITQQEAEVTKKEEDNKNPKVETPPKIQEAPVEPIITQQEVKTVEPTITQQEVQSVKPPVKQQEVKAVKLTKSLNLSGKVTLDVDAVSDKEVEIQSTVVYFQPYDNSGLTLKNEDYLIASQNKRFVPSVLAIQKGSTVTFPNMDRILHNVFSVSNVQKFDLGLYSAGKEKTVTFDNPGIIYVHCNVHHSMQADILVLDTPFYTNVDNNGQFSLKGLPDRPGDLYFWHPRAKLQKLSIKDVSSNNNINQMIEVVRKKVPLHTNKFGKSYRPTRDEK